MPLATHTTIDGDVLDLSDLTAEEAAHLRKATALVMAALEAEDSESVVTWRDFNARFVHTTKNPVLRKTDGFVTRESWSHPLYQALYDLDVRLGIQQGKMRAPRHKRWLQDPRQDTFVPVSTIATQKDVQVKSVHKAIDRGDLIAHHGHFEDGRAGPKAGLMVSLNSAKGWKVRSRGPTSKTGPARRSPRRTARAS